MDEGKWGTWGIVIFLLILFMFIGGGAGFGAFGFGGRNAWGAATVAGEGQYLGDKICSAEKQGIIDTARTQYLVEQQTAATNALVQATASTTQAKIDYYEYMNLRDAVSERDRQIMELKNMLFVKDQLAPVNASLADIKCQMLRRPDVTGIGACCPNQAIINGLGINGVNTACGCGTL